MTRTLTAVIFLGTVAGLTVVAQAAPPKNLQILPKTTDEKTVKDLMKAQAKALGVQCDHCHLVDKGDYASDTLENKKTGRAMMKMVHDINTNFLGGKNMVTCGTCHNGKKFPPVGGPDLEKARAADK